MKNNFVSPVTGAPGSDGLIAAPVAAGGLGQKVALASGFNNLGQYLTHNPESKAEDKGLSLEINRDYDNMTLTSVTAIRNFDTNDFGDVDFGAAPLLTDRNLLDLDSFSQELRWSGDYEGANGRDGHYQFGFYYYSQDVNNDSTLTTGAQTTAFFGIDPTLKMATDALAGLYAGATAGIAAAITGNPVAYGLPAAATAAQINAVAVAANPYPTGAADSFPNGAYARDVMNQEHKSYAFFGQIDVPVRDYWTLTAGLRYTNEEKTMVGTYTNSTMGPVPDIVSTGPGSILHTLGAIILGAINPVTQATTVLPILAPLYAPTWGYYTQPSLSPRPNVSEKLEDDQVTGNIKVAYQPNDDMMFYGSYSTGYKAGGTNTDRLSIGLPYIFMPEKTEVLEFGGKMDLTDTLRVNVAAWKMNVDNLQVSTFTGNSFNLQNQGYTEASGGELDIIWAPTESTQLDVSYAQVVATAKEFTGASCWVATPWHTGLIDPGAPGADPDATACDHSGITKAEPENRLFVALTQGFNLGDTTGYIRLEQQSVSESDTLGSGDPLHFRPSFTFANARVGFIFEELNSELAFWVRNATDEHFYESVFNNPVQDGSLRAYHTEPRTWGVNFRINFD